MPEHGLAADVGQHLVWQALAVAASLDYDCWWHQQSHRINELLNAFAALGSVALFAGSYQIFAVTPATACDWYNMISTKRPIGKPPATINALILKSLK